MSPAARSRRKLSTLTVGVLLVALWVLAVATALPDPSDDPGTTAGFGLLLIPGLVVTVIGGRAELRARAFDRLDRAFAQGLADEFRTLCAMDPSGAYRPGPGLVEIRGARLVEIERHFDQRTVGTVAGRLSHQLSLFGGTLNVTYGHLGLGGMSAAVNGMSNVSLDVEQTTSANLMGDALFAVLEAPGPAGPDDTYRVVSVSAATAAEWIQALVFAAIDRLEGPRSFAGATMAAWSGRLIGHFAPQDISYAGDRLRAQASRAPERRDVLTVQGLSIGRNAVLGAYVQIGQQGSLLLFPVQFPTLFGQAVATAAHRADLTVRPSLSTALVDRAS